MHVIIITIDLRACGLIYTINSNNSKSNIIMVSFCSIMIFIKQRNCQTWKEVISLQRYFTVKVLCLKAVTYIWHISTPMII